MIQNDLDILSKKTKISWGISIALCVVLIIGELLVQPRMLWVVVITVPVCVYAIVMLIKILKIYKGSQET
ncbi:MAG: hypothetical protein PHD70_11595 [Anaerostipes sp.]|nr:hypothetical protein [Anaerostipes sp.]MDD3747099.1 hypothetical protein [Anaerostipes sp.]